MIFFDFFKSNVFIYIRMCLRVQVHVLKRYIIHTTCVQAHTLKFTFLSRKKVGCKCVNIAFSNANRLQYDCHRYPIQPRTTTLDKYAI